jgi:L-rhamnose mutarotase
VLTHITTRHNTDDVLSAQGIDQEWWQRMDDIIQRNAMSMYTRGNKPACSHRDRVILSRSKIKI